MSTPGQIAFAAFFFFLGLAVVLQSVLPVVGCVLAWLVGWRCQSVDRRRERNRRAQARAEKGAQYPGVFDGPPLDLAAEDLPDQPQFRVFDNMSCEHLGEITREQLQFLIRWHQEFGTGAANDDFCKTNDIYILEECLDDMANQGADPVLIESLRTWVAKDHALELRWVIDSQS